MIYIKDSIKEKLNQIDFNDVYLVMDFDQTITAESEQTWGILEHSDFINVEYAKESLEMLNYYHPIEFDPNFDPKLKAELMEKWWKSNIDLFVKYNLKEETVNNAMNDSALLKFRNGGKEFFDVMHKLNVPIVIISAGIGNFIIQFLEYHNCLSENIYVASNFINFENGVAVGIKGNIIHSLNKNTVAIDEGFKNKLKNRNSIILFGDHLADVKMVNNDQREKTIKVGFLDYNVEEHLDEYLSTFDIVGTDDTSFLEILELIKK